MISPRDRSLRRKNRVKSKIEKTTKCSVKLSVFKSNAHISCQLTDIKTGKTLFGASSVEKILKKPKASNCNVAQARAVGNLIAERASEKGVSKVVFDRGPYKYHGVIRAFCESARTKLEF
jgi:large subunit ribosomal protein L18